MSNEFRQAATGLILVNGSPVADGDWIYSWQDFNYDHELVRRDYGCSWVATEESTIKEVSFSAFTDTFHENSQETVLTLSHVNCTCGKYIDVEIGVKDSIGNLLQGLIGPIEREFK